MTKATNKPVLNIIGGKSNGTSKKSLSEAIFLEIASNADYKFQYTTKSGEQTTRNEFIKRCQAELGMGSAHASTYYSMLVKEHVHGEDPYAGHKARAKKDREVKKAATTVAEV